MKALIEKIRAHAAAHPDAEAVVCNNLRLSYAELVQQIDQTAGELAGLGFKRLALFAGNDLDWLLVDLAAGSLNLPVVPIPLFFSSEQRTHLLKSSGVDGVYCGRGMLLLEGSEVQSELLPGQFRRLSSPHRQVSGEKVDDQGSSGEPSPVGFSKITYTSGSTGTPKGACLNSETMLTIVDSLSSALEPSRLGRHLCLLPFATLLENVAGIFLPLWMGRALVIEDTERLGLISNSDFDVAAFCRAIVRYQIESVILLPQMLKLLLETSDPGTLNSLKFIAVGGGKVPAPLLEQAQKIGLPVYEGYGLTECGSCVALNTPGQAKVGSVGKPLRHANVRIADHGEVIVTGAAMSGYLHEYLHEHLDNSAATGDIHTGDAGFIDDDGYLHITGRIKNTIVSSFGRNISPEWVESAFLSSPLIHQIAVFGEAEPYLSAVIVAADSVTDTQLADVVAQINKTLPDYAQIKAWYRSLRPFSSEDGALTTNGKLCRSGVAALYSHHLAKHGVHAA